MLAEPTWVNDMTSILFVLIFKEEQYPELLMSTTFAWALCAKAVIDTILGEDILLD